jgi:hypothetical protein
LEDVHIVGCFGQIGLFRAGYFPACYFGWPPLAGISFDAYFCLKYFFILIKAYAIFAHLIQTNSYKLIKNSAIKNAASSLSPSSYAPTTTSLPLAGIK